SYAQAYIATGTNSTTAVPFSPLSILAYVDSDWAGCADTRRSTTGWVIQIGNSIVDWSSKKQESVALSSCEAEYVALAAAAQAVAWVHTFMKEMFEDMISGTNTHRHSDAAAAAAARSSSSSSSSSSSFPLLLPPPTLHVDNRSAILLAKNDHQHQRTKHIDIRHH